VGRARLAAIALVLLGGCRVELGAPGESARRSASADRPAGELWVYTSLYRHVVDDLDRLAKEKLPEVRIEWFAAGSEKVAARLEAELAAGGTRADLLLTSDPFYFARLKHQGRLLAYVPPAALRVPRSLIDPDGDWISTRLGTMVLIHNTQLLSDEDAPKSYHDLLSPKLRGKVIMGDPLASGTFFTTVAFLVQRFGWDFFKELHANGVISTGGNSTVIDRVSSGELAAGLCLLENVLASRRKGAPIDYRIPSEGAVLIPGPAAILKTSHNPIAAKAFFDLLLSPEGQAVMVRGDMHSADPRVAGPEGAPSFGVLFEKAWPWSETFVEEIERGAEGLRSTFHQVVQK
jgi:iron(III) transport system substrate-binding protein